CSVPVLGLRHEGAMAAVPGRRGSLCGSAGSGLRPGFAARRGVADIDAQTALDDLTGRLEGRLVVGAGVDLAGEAAGEDVALHAPGRERLRARRSRHGEGVEAVRPGEDLQTRGHGL